MTAFNSSQLYMDHLRDKFNKSSRIVNDSFMCSSNVHSPICSKDLQILPNQFISRRRPIRLNFNESVVNQSTVEEHHDESLYQNLDPFLNSDNEDKEFSKSNGGKQILQNQTLLPLLNVIQSIKSNISVISNLIFNNNCNQSFLDATEEEKFPSDRLVRFIQWHPQCRKINQQDQLRYIPSGKPRVALVFNSNIVEIHHTGDYKLTTKNSIEHPAAITLRHKLHEDLTCCSWRPFYFSTLAVLSSKNGIILWQKIGRQDVKNVATIPCVNVRGKSEKVVPSSNAFHLWSPPNWFKQPTPNKKKFDKNDTNLSFLQKTLGGKTDWSIEGKTFTSWSPDGSILMILWYGTIFTVKVSTFSELHGYKSVPLCKIDGLVSPVAFNFGRQVGLFAGATETGQTIIFDLNQKFKFLSNWNQSQVISKYSMKSSLKIENGIWWEFSDEHKRPSNIEGIFLHHYEDSTKLFAIQIFKNVLENSKIKWNDECKQVFDLGQIISADSGYFNAAEADDTLFQFRSNFIITALAWRDDICLIGHGPGQLTILKARVNVGGIAFQYVKSLDFGEIDCAIVNITIFDNRNCAVTSENGQFHYCKIENV